MENEKLDKILEKLGQPAFRLKQIQKAIYQDGVFDWDEITTIPKDLREALKKEVEILPFRIKNVLKGQDGKSFKALLELKDGNCIETVLISPKPDDWSVCVSTQAGCPLGCAFCATGKAGFKRNLTAEEIEGQVLLWKGYLNGHSGLRAGIQNLSGSRIKSGMTFNIVFMGMGEPFLNWENVREAIKNLHDPELFNFGWRSLSISTAGIPEGIEKMVEEFPQVNLAVSLHFADDEKRSQYMPINRKYNLEKLRLALQNYFSKCRRKVFVEYVMLSGINDRQKDAQDLIRYLKSVGNAGLLHVNLISYNAASGIFRPSSRERMQEFKNYLLGNGIGATIRKSLGTDIQGACGQLAGKKTQK